MTPEQLIKYCIINTAANNADLDFDPNKMKDLTAEQVEELYDELDDNTTSWMLEDLRSGEIETNITAPYSRHYETQSVAAQAPNGQWVGWTYWHGGGKHGNPEEIEWIEHAYLLNVESEKEVVIIQRTFAVAENAN